MLRLLQRRYSLEADAGVASSPNLTPGLGISLTSAPRTLSAAHRFWGRASRHGNIPDDGTISIAKARSVPAFDPAFRV
jgi:hypothetical protein